MVNADSHVITQDFTMRRSIVGPEIFRLISILTIVCLFDNYCKSAFYHPPCFGTDTNINNNKYIISHRLYCFHPWTFQLS